MKCFNPGRESNLVETEGDRDIQNQKAVYQRNETSVTTSQTSNNGTSKYCTPQFAKTGDVSMCRFVICNAYTNTMKCIVYTLYAN